MHDSDQGYTLIETLVAMVIFGLALLPLSSTFVMLMENRSAETISRALVVGTTALQEPLGENRIDAVTSTFADHFMVRRGVKYDDRIADVDVQVMRVPDTSNTILRLHRSVILAETE